MGFIRNRRAVRVGVVILIAVLIFVPLNSYADSMTGSGSKTEVARQASIPFEERESIAPPRENVTVYTGQGFVPPGGPNTWVDNALVALAPDGRLLYYEAKYDAYQDVDPSPEGKRTVLFTASDYTNQSRCNATVDCQRDFVVRLNLTTGERKTLYTFTAPRRVNNKLHDVDRIGEHRLLVAGMAYDRVYIVNTSSNVIEWEWSVQQEFNFSSGGPYPDDWTHINDVEFIPHKGENGWIMASLRNQDQIVFIDLDHGLVENWTLGSDDSYDTLYEQHNPDYIPESKGGPAILIADSQNRRIVEYQWHEGDWKRTWTWADRRLSWPRDADRLPNGNTLISDTNGNRLIEVNQEGEVVWSVETGSIYEAERIGTADESTGGESAAKLGVKGQVKESTDQSIVPNAKFALISLVPEKVKNGIRFVLPKWAGFVDVIAIAGIVAVLVVWAVIELRWSSFRFRLRSPLLVEREE